MAVLCQMLNGVAVNNYTIDKQTFHIGRATDSDIYIEEPSVSSKHAVIEEIKQDNDKAAEYQIRDLGSTNSTFVNGEKITACKLKNNDLIRVGFTVLKFVEDASRDLTDTVEIKKSWIPGVYYTDKG